MSVRQFLDNHITHTYGATAEYPWASAPSYGVYRHSHNKKWFAVIMDIPAAKLGLENDEIISIVNLKCDPILIGSLHKDNGIYPAYHMNKSYWISVVLDGTVDTEKLKWLTEISHTLTKGKAR
jgi:predicted DNA-binding protein (MmcQ/YjbR family)